MGWARAYSFSDGLGLGVYFISRAGPKYTSAQPNQANEHPYFQQQLVSNVFSFVFFLILPQKKKNPLHLMSVAR